MIEAAAQSAWSTDRGGLIAALHAEKIILPAPSVIERAAIAGRARARKRAADALLANISPAQLTRLDRLLVIHSDLTATRCRLQLEGPRQDRRLSWSDRSFMC
jgi:hypothetical protein